MDYSEEPRGLFLVIDNKSFYATVECTMRAARCYVGSRKYQWRAGAGVIPNG